MIKKIKSPLKLSYSKGWVRVVFEYGQTFRYPLIKMPEDCFLSKSNTFKSGTWFTGDSDEWDALMHRLQDTIKSVCDACEDIKKTLKRGDTIKKSMVDKWVDDSKHPHLHKTVDRNGSLVDAYVAWMAYGEGSEKTPQTKKDYYSTLHMLMDYVHDYGELSFNDLDMIVIRDFIEYGYEERDAENPCYMTRGGLSNKTINKRLDCLWGFLRSYYGGLPTGLEKKPRLEVLDHRIIKLEPDELDTLYHMKVDDPKLEYARDCLLFLCYTGLRFGDFQKLDRTYYNCDTNEIVLRANKTSHTCRIYLFDRAKEIGEKYDFRFAPKYNSALNRDIKRLLERYDLCGQNIDIEYMAKDRVVSSKKRRDMISCHTGRRTFVSMCMDSGLSCYDVMGATGHQSPKMLIRYYDLFGNGRNSRFAKMNERINEHGTTDCE